MTNVQVDKAHLENLGKWKFGLDWVKPAQDHVVTLLQASVTLAGHAGCHIHKRQAAGCHRVFSASSGLISRALQFIQHRPWPGRLVFPNRGCQSKWADTIPAYAWFIETDCCEVDRGVRKSKMLDPTDCTSRYSDNTVHLYSGGARFESWSWYWLLWQAFHGFTQAFMTNTRFYHLE